MRLESISSCGRGKYLELFFCCMGKNYCHNFAFLHALLNGLDDNLVGSCHTVLIST